jgi:hypothetical protein
MRSTKAEVRQRVEALLEIRLSGAEFSDLRRFAQENNWGCSDAQIWRYVKKSDAILAETLERDREKIFNRHIGQRRALFARAMSVSDYPTCLRILRDEAELFGLYPSTGRSGHQPEAGSSGAAIEAVALKITQNLILNFGNGEQTAEQLMAAAEQLRQQAALLSQEKPIHAAPSQQETEPCQPAALSG